jgi:hypothetical protein
MVGDRPWVGPPWHASWFARCTWDPAAEAEDDLRRYSVAAFRDGGPAMAEYYREAEGAYRELLDLHDLEPFPRHDVLDYSDRPREALALKARELRHAADVLLLLSNRIPARDGRLAAEHAQAQFIEGVARHLAHRLSAWDFALSDDKGAARRELDLAEAALGDIQRWDNGHNTAAYGNITLGMRRAMAHYVEEIRRLVER